MKAPYRELGIEAYANGDILLLRCPKCNRENWALEVANGKCCWCGYDAHEDQELKERIDKYLNIQRK